MVMQALMALARGAPAGFRFMQGIGKSTAAVGRLSRSPVPRFVGRAMTSRPVTYGTLGFGAASLMTGGGGGGGGVPQLGAGGGGPSSEVAYSWNTGTAEFHRLANGKIGTYKRNGVWKEWRPYHPVVIPKHWNARSMNRVASALDRQQDTAIKIVKMAGGDASKTKRRAPAKEPMYSKGSTQIVRAG